MDDESLGISAEKYTFTSFYPGLNFINKGQKYLMLKTVYKLYIKLFTFMCSVRYLKVVSAIRDWLSIP